jgi:RHS repeat-associated protein
MKSWVSDRRIVVAILSIILICLSSAAIANVGRTVGTYAVSPTGAAIYTIPIWAPRGPNGLEPHISLVYSSQQGSGYVGVGWAVAGISSIYRCNLTVAQDGTAAPVALTTGDGLCLDGRRLRLTSGTPDEAGSTYQTEVANFENVTAYETAGNGPSYFVVKAPNGTQYQYGNTADSQVLASGTSTALQWYLNKVTDTAGNTMTIAYCSNNNSYCTESGATGSGMAVPAVISWTPISYGATTYSYTMNFNYVTNAEASSIYAYVAGTQVVNTSLLSSITVAYEGGTVKKYALTYQQSPTTEREELFEVEECADSAQTNCLAPTTITYQNGVAGPSTAATSALSGASDLTWNYDFNGDGREDLAFCTTGSPSTVEVAFSTGSGYGTPINTGATCAGSLYGDVLGDGQDGILANNGGTWYYYTWNGSSFSGVSTGVTYDSTSQYVLADVNGDGLADLIESKLTTNSNVTIYVRLNNSSGSTISFSTTNSSWFTDSDANITFASITSNTAGGFGNLRRLDFNGDGRDDLVLNIGDTIVTHGPHGETVVFETTIYELLSASEIFNKTEVGFKTSSSYMPVIQVGFLNFNSDTCTDLLFSGDGSTTQNIIYVSGCDGSLPETADFGPVPVIGVMDWNGDGLGDILVQNGSTIGVYESTGNGLSGMVSTSFPYSSSNEYFTFDADGDGLDDLGVWSLSSPYAVTYHQHNGDGQPPDLLSSVTDGYGNFAKPAYVSIAQSAGTTYTPGAPTGGLICYPNDSNCYQNYIGPIYVVSAVTYSDASNQPNGTYTLTHTYSNAQMDVDGRGFSGFKSHTVADSRNDLSTLQTYATEFPFTSMPGTTTVTNSASGHTVSTVSETQSYTELSSTPDEEIWFPYVTSFTGDKYEVGGTDDGQLIATTSGSYSYDTDGNIKVASQTLADNATGDSWTKTVTNTPDPDTSTWCLRLLSESQISYTASDGSPSVTRTQDYTPDLTNCRYTQIETAPGTSYQVTEGLAYDDFGNIETDTVTGTGMTARVTSANWGTTGQFPMSVTDASNATTQFNYNFDYGLVSNETDPNGLITSWQYTDGFGRLTQETRADGTYTALAYALASPAWDPLVRLYVTKQINDSSGHAINTVTDYSDMLDRPLYEMQVLLDGTNSWLVTQHYDSMGNLSENCPPVRQDNPSINCTVYTHDVLNRVTQVQRPINQSDSTLQTTSYAYAGDTVTITDPNENTRTLTKDVNGWLRQTEDAMGYTVILGYDAAGFRTSVKDANGNTLWTGTPAYGISPFLVGEWDVDRGTWGYTVDALGERTAWTDPKGQQFYASYDALSRPLTRTEPDLFTQWTWGSSAASHNIGKLASVCSGTASPCSSTYYAESETYDSLGRPYQRTIAIPSKGNYTYTWQYSATTGLLNTLTYPVGGSGQSLELQYGYENGILQSITDIRDSPNVTVWQANAVNPAGQTTQETLGNGLVTSRAYDSVTQWLSSVESGPGGGASIQNLSFLYDEMGNVTQRQDGIHNLSENIYYDNDYRLSYSTLGGTQNLSMGYDPMGNITNKSTVSNNATWTYDSVHLHQVREAGSTAYKYTYDANGNMTSWAGEPITWTSYNYPIQITDTSDTFTFSYAPDRSIWLEVQTGGLGSTTYRLGSPLMSIVVDSSGTTDRNYIYAGNEPVAIDERTNASNTFYYLLTDHQGSISGITNSAGQVVINESFHPDGQRRNPTTWTDPVATSDVNTIQGISPRGYTFKETLEYMNLIDFGGRVEDVFTGRFLSADPYIPDPTDPQSYNRYSYTVNNPLTYTDPTGFFTQKDPDGAPEGGITAAPTLPPVQIPGDPWTNGWQNTGCGANIFCFANTFGGTGVLEGNLENPQYHFGPVTPPSSRVPQTPGQQSNPPTVTIPGLNVSINSTYDWSSASSLDYSLSVQDYVYAGLGGYSGLSRKLLESAGYESAQMLGKLDFSLPSNIVDLPNGVAGVATIFEAYVQYENGDYYGAVQTSGSGLGGIYGGNLGVDIGAGFGSAFSPAGTIVGGFVGGFIGGIGGSYVGGNAAGILYNNAYTIGNTLSTWGQNFNPYSF